MKSINQYMRLLLGMVLLSFASCDSFLDRQEDEAMTFEKIWNLKSTTAQYWYNAMSFLPRDADNWPYDIWVGAADETSVTYAWDYRNVNSGSWNPTSGFVLTPLNKYYQGIRECNIFLQNIDRCTDPLLTPSERAMWKVQTRWAKAYYNFLLMRIYGPIVLAAEKDGSGNWKDVVFDFNQTTAQLERPRNTWDECVDYVTKEMEACAADTTMQNTWRNDSEKGLATKGACYAVISRLKTYSARPLFNGNALYKNLKYDGVNIFPATFSNVKWREAALAAKRVINMGVYELYKDPVDPTDPYKNILGITKSLWNKEIIYSSGYSGLYIPGVHTAPTGLQGGISYGGVGPTQQQVDAYAMKSGVYPINGYNEDHSPVIDERSGYTEEGKSKFPNPSIRPNGSGSEYASTLSKQMWPNMYKDREPRFYMHVFWSDSYWQHGPENSNYTLISFGKGGNSNKSHDYPKSGYLVNKYYDHSLNSTTGNWGYIVFPTFRLAEIYLNFIEAALEYKNNGGSDEFIQEAMLYWNELRQRAGVPAIEEAYPGATTAQLIELVRRERRVELAFENHRYFDTRTWMIAEQTDNGPFYGMNTSAPTSGNITPTAFWKRTIFETRVFQKKHYLYPFPQRELDRNKKLVQNYGW
jgi:starch-binding outer membrane protein, SusD/RagB family